jgi:hypothetical protein
MQTELPQNSLQLLSRMEAKITPEIMEVPIMANPVEAVVEGTAIEAAVEV